MLENGHLAAVWCQGRSKGKQHAQVGDDAKLLGRTEMDGCLVLGMNANALEFQVH